MTAERRTRGKARQPDTFTSSVSLDSRIDGVLVRTVAAGLLAAMRRDGAPFGPPMVARHLLRHGLGPEHVEAVAGAMQAAGLVQRVAGAAASWRARSAG